MRLKINVFVLFLLLVAPPAAATTVLEVDIDDLTRVSEWIVRADVVAVKNVDLRRQGEGIFTDVTLRIHEVYRGEDVPATYVLRLVGGVGDDGVTMLIPGMPRFSPGEDVVLFLEKTRLGHVPAGLGQGVWRVVRGPDQVEWVRQQTGSVNLMRRDANGQLATAAPRIMTPARLLGDLALDIYAAQLAQLAQP